MKRRNFFSWMAGAGLACTGLTRGAIAGFDDSARGLSGLYTGPFFVGFGADGGWDPTGFCDPHANLHNGYGGDGIVAAGGIQYANVGSNADFFGRFADKLLVLNGLDVSTNSHAVGRRHVWTGRQDETHPHWGALAAGTHGPQQPLSFIAEGTYSFTEGTVAQSRVSNNGVLTDLSFPERVNPAIAEDLSTYQSGPASEMIADWRSTRLARMETEQHLPRARAAINNLVTTRSGANELEQLQAYLPDELSTDTVQRQIQIAVAAYKAGIAVSATFSVNGFDTHQNNDAAQDAIRGTLLGHVAFLWDEAERQGVAEQILCAVGSDFGRTNEYNGQNGKNHWPITSMLLMGYGIEGNRTVGATDDQQFGMKIDPDTLAPSTDGVMLRPGHVHAALRELIGVSDQLEAQFPLAEEALPGGLFGVA